MKKLFSVLLLIAMVFSLTAVSAYAEEPLKLEFFSRKPEAADCYQSLIDKFNAANPDLKVSLTSTSDADTVLLTRISSNDIPQIENFMRANCDLYFKTVEALKDFLQSRD